MRKLVSIFFLLLIHGSTTWAADLDAPIGMDKNLRPSGQVGQYEILIPQNYRLNYCVTDYRRNADVTLRVYVGQSYKVVSTKGSCPRLRIRATNSPSKAFHLAYKNNNKTRIGFNVFEFPTGDQWIIEFPQKMTISVVLERCPRNDRNCN